MSHRAHSIHSARVVAGEFTIGKRIAVCWCGATGHDRYCECHDRACDEAERALRQRDLVVVVIDDARCVVSAYCAPGVFWGEVAEAIEAHNVAIMGPRTYAEPPHVIDESHRIGRARGLYEQAIARALAELDEPDEDGEDVTAKPLQLGQYGRSGVEKNNTKVNGRTPQAIRLRRLAKRTGLSEAEISAHWQRGKERCSACAEWGRSMQGPNICCRCYKRKVVQRKKAREVAHGQQINVEASSAMQSDTTQCARVGVQGLA